MDTLIPKQRTVERLALVADSGAVRVAFFDVEIHGFRWEHGSLLAVTLALEGGVQLDASAPLGILRALVEHPGDRFIASVRTYRDAYGHLVDELLSLELRDDARAA